MGMVKKILKILAKIIAGIFIFYLVAGFILIPLALTWGIPSLGTKYLKHPVHLRWVTMNPLLLQVNMKGLEILDAQKQVMAGFDRLFVDVSFLQLLKKVYRVEAIELDGLKMNVELLEGGRVNLQDLAPAVPASPPVKPEAGTGHAAKPSAGPSAPFQPSLLPVVIIDKIILHQGRIHFIDRTIQPNFSTTLSNIEVNIANITTKPEDQAKFDFQANLDDKGKISTEAVLKPLAQPLQMETTFDLNGYAMDILSPYTGKYTGRQLKDGQLDLKMNYQIGGHQLRANHQLLIQHFEFGQKVPSKDALPLPFGLAVALLEDPQGRINIALPVTGDMSSPKFAYWPLVGQVVRNFFIKLVTKPFSALASLLGSSESGTEELGYVRFSPGRAELADSEKQKLNTLIKGLKERPKLRLVINGSYDPQVDWKAIQFDVFTKDYNALRKISSHSEGAVYQQLYQRRFGIWALWALAKKYKKGMGSYDDIKLDQEIKRQLIETAPPDVGALGILAQARAQIIYNYLLSLGLDEHRLSLGTAQTVQSTFGYVPLEFTLTVFEKS